MRIGIVGKTPEVEEKNIMFSELTFEQLENDLFSINTHHDALFIMPEKLSEVDAEQYVEIYKQLNIPTFFIGTTKAHIPFIFEEAIYSKVSDVSPKTYAARYLYDKNSNVGQHWRFYKENDGEEKITDKEIKIIYSEIFSTINSIN